MYRWHLPRDRLQRGWIPSRGRLVLSELHGAALKVGPHATRIVEPRQARKGATVRRPSRVPWEYLTGAGSGERSRYEPFEGGCTVIVLELEIAFHRGWRVIGTGGSARRINPWVIEWAPLVEATGELSSGLRTSDQSLGYRVGSARRGNR